MSIAAVECPRIEAVATMGTGVFDTLKAVAKAIVTPLRKDTGGSAG